MNQIEIIRKTLTEINSAQKIDGSFELNIDNISKIIGITFLAIAVYNEEYDKLILINSNLEGFKTVVFEQEDSLIQKLLSDKKPLKIKDAREIKKLENIVVKHNLSNFIFFPLLGKESLNGILIAGERDEKSLERKFFIISLTARFISISIQNNKYINKIKKAESIDATTGLYIRKSFIKYAEEIFKDVKTKDSNIFLLMIKIDDFKKYNDKSGYWCGDKAFESIGKIILGCLSQSNIAGRYGPNLFTIISENSAEYINEISKKIKERIEDHLFLSSNCETGEHLKVSIYKTFLSGNSPYNSIKSTIEKIIKNFY